MIYRIYHVKRQFIDVVAFGFGRKGVWPEEYEKVAEVDASSLEEAFQLTNTIDSPWYENKQVSNVNPCRSTSVGDVIIDPQGRAHRCLILGFESVDKEPSDSWV